MKGRDTMTMRGIGLVLLGLWLAIGGIGTAQAQDLGAIHNDLRALKQRAVDAVNKKDLDALLQELSPTIHFTAMNNETFSGLDQAREYYDKMMVGANRIVDEMSMKADADALAVLYADNRIAVATGTSDTFFKIKGGLTFDVPLRWTATLENNGSKWTIAAIHFSANMFDNPLLSGAALFWKLLAGGVGLAGLVIGFLFGRWRRKAV
jgi:ketosteroid isomerase-like protein